MGSWYGRQSRRRRDNFTGKKMSRSDTKLGMSHLFTPVVTSRVFRKRPQEFIECGAEGKYIYLYTYYFRQTTQKQN